MYVKRRLSFLIIICCYPFFSMSQPNTFFKMYVDSQETGIQSNALVATMDTGFVMTGELYMKNAMIMKISKEGDVKWSKIIGSKNNGFPHFNAYSLVRTYDSCFLITGSYQLNSTTVLSALCMKMDAKGNPLWSKIINYSGYDTKSYCVDQTRDSGFIFTGTSSIGPNNSKIFILKLDRDGNLKWSNLLGSAGSNVAGYKIRETTDSAYVIMGTMESKNSCLLKVSSKGTFLWGKRYTLGARSFFGNDVLVLNNGFLCYSGKDIVTLLKTDFTGNPIWCKSYNQISSGYPDIAPSSIAAYGNNFILVNGNCLSAGAMIKVDSTGEVIWSKSLNLIPVDVKQTYGNNLLILGNGPLCFVSPGTKTWQMGIIQTDSMGDAGQCVSVRNEVAVNAIPSVTSLAFQSTFGAILDSITYSLDSVDILTYIQCVNNKGGISDNSRKNEVMIIPNPSRGVFSIMMNENMGGKIEIYDLMKNRIYNAIYDAQQLEVDLSSYPSGMYFYNIISGNKNFTGKLIVVK